MTDPATRSPLRKATLALALVTLALPGCDLFTGPVDRDPGVEITALPRALTLEERQLLQASNTFGFDLLKALVGREPVASHFLSPLSASMALGMTMKGSDGETWEAMREALRFGTLPEAEINASYRALIHLLGNLDPRVSFQLANSVWHPEGWPPLEAFVAALHDYFDAEVRGIDFQAPGASDTINAWVNEKSEGRIEEIVPNPIPQDVVMYLLNAIHFKGDWTRQFDPSETRDGNFHLPDGSTVPVRYMRRQGGFRVHWRPNFTALELPYGGGAFAMTVLVPREVDGLPGLVGSLDDELWEEVSVGLTAAEDRSEILLPRFTLTWEKSLNEALFEMGMGIAFGGGADFSRIFGDGGIHISEVLQKTFLRVDEEGTEAAAVTSVELVRTSGPPAFRVDRPFLIAIRERLSGTIIFLGAISEAPLD